MAASPQTTAAPGGASELACVRADGLLYGIDVLRVRQIVRARPVTPLPRTPALLEGVVDLRGSVIPVVDLGRALGGRPAPEDESARLVLVEVEDLLVGLRVEEAVDVLSAAAGELQAPPPLATRAGCAAVRAVLRRAAGPPVLVLSPESLLEIVQGSAPDAARADGARSEP